MPDQLASEDDLSRAQEEVRQAVADLQESDRELAQAQGALLGAKGFVVRERYEETRQAFERAKAEQRELELDADAWQLLLKTLREAETHTAQHLGRALASSVAPRFDELTRGRYGALKIDSTLRTEGIEAAGATRTTDLLSEGTKHQLATLLRLAIAESLKSAIVLDDHLVNTDPSRLEWFAKALRQAARTIQVIVLTCRREDYVSGASARAEKGCQAIDLQTVLRRANSTSENPPRKLGSKVTIT
jgi:uncharacterized protein YhaN